MKKQNKADDATYARSQDKSPQYVFFHTVTSLITKDISGF